MAQRQWSFGDRLVHVGRPEWGVGVVAAAQGDNHAGAVCQKLTVRFERAGLKTLSTAHADLRAAEELPSLAADRGTDDVLGPAAVGPSPQEVMTRLPQAATDPFSTPRQRLEATLRLYRFSESGGSLLDWAAAQSGLKDALSRFSRHELEELFRRFAVARDEHLKRLALDMKRNEPATVLELGRGAPPAAQNVLRRIDALR